MWGICTVHENAFLNEMSAVTEESAGEGSMLIGGVRLLQNSSLRPPTAPPLWLCMEPMAREDGVCGGW